MDTRVIHMIQLISSHFSLTLTPSQSGSLSDLRSSRLPLQTLTLRAHLFSFLFLNLLEKGVLMRMSFSIWFLLSIVCLLIGSRRTESKYEKSKVFTWEDEQQSPNHHIFNQLLDEEGKRLSSLKSIERFQLGDDPNPDMHLSTVS